MNNPFAAPASASGIDWKELLGSLLLVEPTGVKSGIPTVHGESDAVEATIAVLDGPKSGTVYDSALVFPRVLQSQLSSKVGQKVLGRLTQGQARPGQSAPWLLAEATEQDVQTGMAYLQRSMQPAAASQQAAAQADPWSTQPQAQQQGYQPPQQVNTQTGEIAQHQAVQNVQQGLGGQPVAQQQPAVDAQQIRNLLAAGLNDDQINAATGATPEQVQAIRNLG